jgi:hypothetical protein
MESKVPKERSFAIKKGQASQAEVGYHKFAGRPDKGERSYPVEFTRPLAVAPDGPQEASRLIEDPDLIFSEDSADIEIAVVIDDELSHATEDRLALRLRTSYRQLFFELEDRVLVNRFFGILDDCDIALFDYGALPFILGGGRLGPQKS